MPDLLICGLASLAMEAGRNVAGANFKDGIMGGILGNVAGQRFDSGTGNLLQELRRRAALHIPDANHDVQRALMHAWWASLLQISAAYGDRISAPLTAQEPVKIPHGTFRNAILDLLGKVREIDGPAGALQQADQLLLRHIYSALLAKLDSVEEQLKTSEATRIAEASDRVEELLTGDRPMDQALANLLTARALSDLEKLLPEPTEEVKPELPQQLKASIEETFAHSFAGVFHVFIKSDESVKSLVYGRLLADITLILKGGSRHAVTLAQIDEALDRQTTTILSGVEALLDKKLVALSPPTTGTLRTSISRIIEDAGDPLLSAMRGYFIGREKEVSELLDFLSGPARVGVVYSIQGAGGVGKSELCKAALKIYLTNRPGQRACYIDVTGIETAAQLRLALALALGDDKLSLDLGNLLTAAHQRLDLIYFDNLEDALPEGSPESSATLHFLEQAAATGLKLLASSRRSLGTLALPIQVPVLDGEPSEALFRHFWRGAPLEGLEDFRIFLKNDLSHHPLSIRLVASVARAGQTWHAVQKRWQTEKTAMAREGGHNDRHWDLDASIGLSYRQAASNPTALLLWHAMPCFPDGMRDAARHFLVPNAPEREPACDLLLHLNIWDFEGDRFRMLAPLAQFAERKAMLPGEPVKPEPVTTTWSRLFAYHLHLANNFESNLFTSDVGPSIDALRSEMDNLLRTVQLTLDARDLLESREELVASFFNFVQFDLLRSRTLLEMINSDAFSTGGKANTLQTLGDIEGMLSRYDEAREYYRQALPLYEQARDVLGKANTLKALGDIEGMLSRYDEAREYYRQALPLYEQARDVLGKANTLKALGDIERMLSHYDEAREYYRQALPLYEQARNVLGKANTLQALGDIERMLSRYDEAREYYRQALPLYEQARDVLGKANTLQALGDIEGMLSRYDEAREYYRQALPLFEQARSVLGKANTLQALGDIERMLSHYDEAREYYRQALPLYEQARDVLGKANTLKALGDIEGMLSRFDEAREYYRQALPLYEQARNVLGKANTLQALGDIERMLSRFDEARDYFTQALPLFEQARSVRGKANTLQALGDIERMLSRYDEAREYYRQALPLYEQARDVLGKANTLQALGDIERMLGHYDEAQEYYRQALPLYEQARDVLGKANTLQALGRIERMLSRFDEAREYFTQALPLFEQARDVPGLSYTNAEMAVLEAQTGNGESARNFASTARRYARTYPNPILLEHVEATLKRAHL